MLRKILYFLLVVVVVVVDGEGALLVADDVGNTIWRVMPSAQQAANN